MRVTSHCANHPSREARQRCGSCRKWLCDSCLSRFNGRVYCDKRCQLTGRFRDLGQRAISFARRPLHPAWVMAVTAGASALLIAAVGIHVAELVEVKRGIADARSSAAIDGVELSGRIVVEGEAFQIEASGAADSSVLVMVEGRPVGVLTLDNDGRGELAIPPLEPGDDTIQLAPLGRGVVDLEPPPLAMYNPTATPTFAAPAKPTATLTPTATKTATARHTLRRSAAVDSGPTPVAAPPILQLVQDAGPRIAITFDGNGSSNRTDELLELLQERDLRVTFFVTGQFIRRYPEIVRHAILAGHEIGNHTFSHPHLTTYAQNHKHQLLPGMTRARFQEELMKTEKAFTAATGRRMKPLWRAPFGEENRILRGWALEMGYLHVRWSSLEGASLDTRDWVADEHSSLYQSSPRIMERLLRFPHLGGGIILMHLATERAEPPWAELPVFLDALEKRGLKPTLVTRLLEASPTWRPWLRRAQENHGEVNGK
jgi:peptidoglycan/xylan/chitin deacetylase (PgdA/CDA1 family)